MSVVGFDFGHLNSAIAVARRGGIDTIANEVSNRLTPSMVSFGQKERFVGESALNQLIMNFKNTLGGVQTFLGRQFKEPEIQEELKRYSVPAKELPNGEVGFQVTYNGEPATFSATQIAAMILHKLKTTTEKEINGRMSDVVLSCPGYFTDLQRRALIHASEIAGLNCVRLLNESTATALYWGFYKRDLPENDPIHVVFVDSGYTTTNVTVVDFTKTKMKVVGYAFDRNLGGRNIDEVLANHFNEEVKAKWGINVMENHRARIRLIQGCEKLKKVLSSGVTESVLNIESLSEDRDFTSRLTKVDFEAMIQSQLDRMGALVNKALETAGVTVDQVSAVEIVGGNKRVPAVQRVFSELLKKDLQQTMNDAESVAKGCALQCAMLSPAQRVRQYGVSDINVYPIKITWSQGADEMQVEGSSDNSAELFPINATLPASKFVTLPRNAGFEIVAQYNESPLLPAGHPRLIGKFVVSNPPAASPEAKENPKIKVKIRISPSGVFGVESAEYQETIEVEEPATPTPAANAAPSTPTPDAGKTESAEAKPAENGAPATPEPNNEPAKKRKIRNTALTVNSIVSTLNKSEVQNLLEEESKMQAQDRLAAETADAKNAVESYILGMRNRLTGDLNEYSTESERSTFDSALTAAEDWLYDEGDDVTKGIYVAKKKDLQKLGDPIENRKIDHDKREVNYSELQKTIQHYRTVVHDGKYDHIEQDEKNKIVKLCQEAEGWADTAIAKQRSLPKTSPATLTPFDLTLKKEEIERLANPILAKPKPAPPAPAPAPTPAPATPTPDVPMTDATSEEKKTPAADGDVPMTDAPAS